MKRILIVLIGLVFLLSACNGNTEANTNETTENKNEEEIEKESENINEETDEKNDSNEEEDRKSTRLNSSHVSISYAVFCLKKKTTNFDQPAHNCAHNRRQQKVNLVCPLLECNYGVRSLAGCGMTWLVPTFTTLACVDGTLG